jgi:type I restriction enzyme S subunit
MTELVQLGEVASVFNGKTPSKAEKQSSGHPVLKIKDVDEQGNFQGVFDSFVDQEFANRFAKKTVRANDVLVLNAAHNADYVGSKMLKAPVEVEGSIATGEWLLARSSSSRLDQAYLWHWFQLPLTRSKIRQKVKGIHLYPRDVAEMEIPLPPLLEQRRIAAILDKADDIRRKREQALTLADEFLRSVFLDLFGDPSANPMGYPINNFETVLLVPLRNGISPSTKGELSASVLTLTAITGDRFDAGQVKEGKFLEPISEKDTVNRSDFYICRGNGSADLIGKGYFADRDLEGIAFPDTIIAAKPDPQKVARAYLEKLWNSPFVRNQIREAARTTNGTFKINQTAAGAIKVPIPPLSDQENYQAIVDKVRRSESKLEYGDELLPALSQRAFVGEL